MPTSRLFALLLLIGCHVMAQTRLPLRAPSEIRAEIDPAGGFTTTSSPASPAPDTPAVHPVMDKKFIAVMGALGGAESLRFTTRELVLEHEFAAGAPWVTRVPANQHLIAKYSGLYAAELFVAYELKKPHSWLPGDRVVRKLWWAYPASMAAIHTKNGIGNIRTRGPGGCSSVECAMQIQ